MSVEKEWTIMIYANGNNELEPEISLSKESAEKAVSSNDINVIMQIAKANREIARILRPNKVFTEVEENWTGMRRYLIDGNSTKLLEDYPCNINMASPSSLSDFIIYSAKRFPAKHYVLVVGGHGYQFVGCMTDYAGDAPYIMGIPETAKAIELACSISNIEIDLLVLDTCYFNFIEVLYEFSETSKEKIKYLMTYVLNAPLKGINFCDFINIIIKTANLKNLKDIIKNIINECGKNLVAFELNNEILYKIKNCFNELAEEYERKNEKKNLSLSSLFSLNDNENISDKAKEIKKYTKELILYSNNSRYKKAIINVASKNTTSLEHIKIYNKLAFSKDNKWTNLLYLGNFKELPPNNDFEAIKLSSKVVFSYVSIMNPHSSMKEKQQIYNKLLQYKNWNLS